MQPCLYQINTRAWLYELSQAIGRPATLADVPNSELDFWAQRGFNWIWLLGIWETGEAGRRMSIKNVQWHQSYQECLGSSWSKEDICGSPFAIKTYVISADFGGEKALSDFRARLHQRGLRLLLDFVPNHTAMDHAWAGQHPEFYVHGTEGDLVSQPENFCRILTSSETHILAHGRDPYFPGWADTLQLNYRHPGLKQSMLEQLLRVAERCDGVRCDMAMLILPQIFRRTWQDHSLPWDGTAPDDTSFWPEAISRVRRHHASFLFMAEVYWDLERILLQQGFDYTYNKGLYDDLRDHRVEKIQQHLRNEIAFQRHQVRFLENHDEPRASQVFPWAKHQAAALLTFLTPGLKFFHDGQLEGRSIKAVIHLRRRPVERPDLTIQQFYERLLSCLRRPEARDGQWQLLTCHPAEPGDDSSKNIISFAWEEARSNLLIVVNYAPQFGQAIIQLPWNDRRIKQFLVEDLLAVEHSDHPRLSIQSRWLVSLPPWGYHVYAISPLKS